MSSAFGKPWRIEIRKNSKDELSIDIYGFERGDEGVIADLPNTLNNIGNAVRYGSCPVNFRKDLASKLFRKEQI